MTATSSGLLAWLSKLFAPGSLLYFVAVLAPILAVIVLDTYALIVARRKRLLR